MLLAKRIKVIASANSQLVGLEGEVVEENRDTIAVRTEGKERLLLKSHITIKEQ